MSTEDLSLENCAIEQGITMHLFCLFLRMEVLTILKCLIDTTKYKYHCLT
jgi:hypothetical protein